MGYQLVFFTTAGFRAGCRCFSLELLGPEDVSLGDWMRLGKPSKPVVQREPYSEGLGLVPIPSAAH